MMEKYRFEVLLFVLYVLLALVVTYPLILNLNNSIYGIRGDHFGQLWEDWWRKEALLSGKSLFYTPLMNAPFGLSYEGTALQPLQKLGPRLALALLTNEVLSLNIWLLLSFPLSGLAVYYLVRKCLALQCEHEMRSKLQGAKRRHFLVKHLTKDKMSAAFSGLVYSFSMYHFSHAWEHSSLIFIFWMPLYVLALVKFNEERSMRSAVIAALLFAAVLLDNFYYGYFTFFFTAFFFLFQFRRWLNWRSLRFFILFALLCLLFSVPLVFPVVRSVLTGNVGEGLDAKLFQRSLHDLNWLSARSWHYVLPSPWHPLWGKYSQRILDWIATKPPYFLTQPYSGKEHNIYLGWTALSLSTLAVLKCLRNRKKSVNASICQWRQRVWIFFALGIVMMIFSAPPYATIHLHKIYFPSHFLYQIFPMFRAYARFGVLVLLCVSVLAGFGLTLALEKIKNRRNQTILTAVLGAVVLLEVLLPSFNVDLTPPEVYQWLAGQPGDFIVMEYPQRSDHTDLLYQRVHRKRLFDPWRSELGQIPEEITADIAAFPNELKDFGLRYIIFHENDRSTPVGSGFFMREGFEIAVRFPDVMVFEVVGQ